MAVKCTKCHSDNTETAKFCSECGTRLYPADKMGISQTKTLKKPKKDQLKGKTIVGRYKVIEKLGEGGMGVVYKAKDTRLDRSVALKFLPPELTRDEEAKQRFIQEAKAAAALNHPQICTIYEIDEEDEQTFISMEYIKGQSLKDKLESAPLAIDEAKDIALQVAAGLEKAHKQGIVHRDIKPANIMINDEGQAKITDFGLAKLSWGADLTKPATIMGTVAYMSPEQARGEEVDHRTDIWSLGAVLYEMLTSERPFKKDKEHALIYEILNEEPTIITSFRSDIPRHIEQTVHKALEKDVGNRFQTMNDLIQELKQSPPIILPKAECSIVVLPFEDMSPNKDNEYFSDGLTEEIITDLSQIHELCVISRNSAMALKGTKKNTKTIGRELNVLYVLEGSVRKAGDNLRITAQLIDARTDVHLWAKKYSGTIDDVFDIQEKVSRSIVDALEIRLSPNEDKRIAERPIDNIHAYECYLKANYEMWRGTEESLNRAIKLIQEGIEVVGENELLYYALGTAYFQYVNLGINPDLHFLEKAESYVNKIFKLNSHSSHAYVLMGLIDETRGNFFDALRDTRRALIHDPNNPMALILLAFLYAISGKSSAAKPLLDHLKKIDPLNPQAPWDFWWIYISEGRLDHALEVAQKMAEKDLDNPAIQHTFAWSLMMNHRENQAIEVVDRLVEKNPQHVFTSLAKFMKHVLNGDKEKAIQALSSEAIMLAKIDHIYSWYLAQFFSLLKEKEEALNWLENAINRGRIDYYFLYEKDPFLENIRGDPRFKRLMERVKHEWENFEV